MAAKEQDRRNKEMAAWLRSRGIFHGKRASSTQATHNYPRATDEAGSAKLHRLTTVRAAQGGYSKATRNPKGLK